jgi:hypothetical protein
MNFKNTTPLKMARFSLILVLFILTNSLWSQKINHNQGEILVQIKPNIDIFVVAQNWYFFQKNNTRLAVKQAVSKPLDIWLLEFDFTKIEENTFLNFLKRQDEILHAQFNHHIYDRQNIPNDPQFGDQWQWLNNGVNGSANDADVDAELAWDLTTGGETAVGQEIVVCVVESNGSDYEHPDLLPNHWTNQGEIPQNGIDDDGNGYIDDYNGWNTPQNNGIISSGGHGTNVTGMVGAVGNNNLGLTGINWNVKIMQVVRGSLGNSTVPNEANVIAAYTYPLVMRQLYNESNGEKGAFVVVTNASWGLGDIFAADAPLWCEMYEEMGQVGILSCGATSNNENINVDLAGDLPTTCESEFFIGVTSTNSNDDLKAAFGFEHVDVAAPGESIWTTNNGDGYDDETGTSFACPLVSGLIGLMYSTDCLASGAEAISDPAGTALAMKSHLFNGVDPLPNLNGIISTGGRVNAFKSLQNVINNCNPCPNPYGILLESLTDQSGTLTWDVVNTVQNTEIRWRELGASNWNSSNGVFSPFNFSNLEACTEYEVQLRGTCSNPNGSWTESLVFKTDGCCEGPSQITLTELTDTSFEIEWNSILAANSYDVMVQEGNQTFEFNNINGTVFGLDNLLPCQDYIINIQSNCATGETNIGPDFEFSTSGCGACLDADYCEAFAQNSSNEWIANVTFNDLNNSSSSDGGYGDYTSSPLSVFSFKAYDILLTPGYSGFAFNEYWKVYIDFNQNGVFEEDSEVAFDAGGISNQPQSGQVIIPGDAIPGLARMRVIMRFGEEPFACDANFNFGEVEDYCVEIFQGDPPVCDPIQNIEIQEVGYEEVTLSWDENPDALSYNVRFSSDGGATWTVEPVASFEATIEELQDCVEYELQIQNVCIGTQSAWSSSVFFTTLCAVPCEEIPQNVDTTDVSFTFVNLSWEATPNADLYRIQYRPEGASQWIFAETPNTEIELIDLLDCQIYEYNVQALCPGNESELSETQSFKTDCISGLYNLPNAFFDLRVFPNPFDTQLLLEFALREKTTLNLTIYDYLGRELYSNQKDYSAGEFQWQLDGFQNWEDGIYFLQINTEKGSLVQKLVKG